MDGREGVGLEAPTMGGTYFAEGGHMIGSSGPVATWGGSRSGSNSERPLLGGGDPAEHYYSIRLLAVR